MTIEVRHINYVIAAADHGSFRRAAAALGVHESAISRRIRDLEIRLGAALFIRSAGGVQLTQAGKTFVRRGRQAMTQLGLARSEVSVIGRGEAGEIKIGILSAVGAGFLSELISDFGAANPTVRMTFVDGDQAEHVGALRLGELDIAFVTGTAEWPECETEQMWTERVFVALPAQHPLAAKEEVSWQDIGAERLIVSDVPPGPEIHDYLIQRLAELARHPLIEHHNVGRFNLLSLVALGRGGLGPMIVIAACDLLVERVHFFPREARLAGYVAAANGYAAGRFGTVPLEVFMLPCLKQLVISHI